MASNLLVIKPIMNSVDEVKVLTGTLAAEYGHSSGGEPGFWRQENEGLIV